MIWITEESTKDAILNAFEKGVFIERPIALKYINRDLYNDDEVALHILDINSDYFIKFPYAQRDNFKMADKSLRKNDRELLLTAIKTNGYAIKYTSRTLRRDPEIISKAIATTDYAITCIND